MDHFFDAGERTGPKHLVDELFVFGSYVDVHTRPNSMISCIPLRSLPRKSAPRKRGATLIPMPYSHILFQVEESGIALLTVNRPEKLNALSAAVIAELADAFSRVSNDPGIRAVVLTGAGEKAFVAGADIGELVALSPFDARAFALRGQAVFRQLEICGKPSVAAVNGFALGGGLELALACTVRFASENAKLGLPEVKLGIIPGYGGTQRLPRLVGRGRALELLLSGETIVAAEAYRIGLVNAVVPAAELLDYCRGWLGKRSEE